MRSRARSIVWIDDDDASDPSLTGAKFARLAVMRRWPAAVRPVVPDAFALSTAAWRAVLEHNGLDRSRPTREQLLAAEVPTDLAEALDAALGQLARRTGVASWAVRSSSPLEDGTQLSYAGQFRSELGVRGSTEVLDAYRRCCAAAVSPNVLAYRRRLDAPEPTHTEMAVIVQEMAHEGEGITGVVFSRHPARRDATLLEVVRGPGELLGRVAPARYVVHAESLVEAPADGPLEEQLVVELADWANRAQERVGSAVDVEFAIDRTGRVRILQLRPLRVDSVAGTEAGTGRGAGAVTGLAVGSGRVVGPVCRVDGPEQVDLLRPGGVLVTQSTDPSWLPLLSHVAAVVTDQGGLTSHAAIVCRELGLLAVVGCGDATRRLRDGERVVVTASAGGRGSVEQVGQR